MVAALLAAAFAGSGFATIASAMDVGGAASAWLSALLAALICGVSAAMGAGALLALPSLATAAFIYALTHLSDLRDIRTMLNAWQGMEADPARAAAGAQALIVCGALLFGALFFLMLYKRGFTGMAIMLLAAMLIFSHGMSNTASISAALPALAAGAAAFALSDGIHREYGAARALVPSALAVALALMALPAGRVTWAPMENLAEKVRSVFEQYFNFTHERIAFSISEEGYNFGGEIDGQAVAMLGGPANPDPKPVMKVTADAPLLLRGAIRATYTGYSWIDVTPKNRYLYYDLTHRIVRDRVFNLNFESPPSAFFAAHGEVELLDSSTSTLFTPGRMSDFEMDLSNAVYYNSSGEMFMAREAQTGDRYRLEVLNPIHDDALEQAALLAEAEDDGQYAQILAAHTQLPDGIEPQLIALTAQLIQGADNAYARAEAIAAYLRGSMRYRLDVPYPPRGRDFASYFVLDAREGYCSYFATAMAVMGRIAGLPTRYVEGYYARPGLDGTATLTGMDAHAWAEVYFNGLGWIPFDTTNGGPAADGSSGGGDLMFGTGNESPDDGNQEETPFDDPSKGADGERDDDIAQTEAGAPEDEPTPQPESEPDAPPPDAPGEQGTNDAPDSPEADDGAQGPRGGWWGLLPALLILLLALAAWWVWKRLQATDIERLCRGTRRAQTAAMMLYRANLTLLSHAGQYPQGGETPERFVERVAAELENPDYADFARAVTLNRYGNRPIKKDDVETGLRAYRTFLRRMRRTERLRFMASRVFRGLGDFENIP